MTDGIDYERLATVLCETSSLRYDAYAPDWIGPVKAVVAAYRAALAEQGLVVVRRDDLFLLNDYADRHVRLYHEDVLDRVEAVLAAPDETQD